MAMFDVVKQRVDLIRSQIEAKDSDIQIGGLLRGLGLGGVFAGAIGAMAFGFTGMGEGIRPATAIAGIIGMLAILAAGAATSSFGYSNENVGAEQKQRLVDELNTLSEILNSAIESMRISEQLTIETQSSHSYDSSSVVVDQPARR